MIRKMLFATAAFTLAQTAAFAADQVLEFDRDRLDDPAYVEALYAEIETAAAAVCKKELIGSPLYISMMRSCVSDTVAASVKKIDSTALTAYAEGEARPARLASSQ